jgi:hypothetical protein
MSTGRMGRLPSHTSGYPVLSWADHAFRGKNYLEAGSDKELLLVLKIAAGVSGWCG